MTDRKWTITVSGSGLSILTATQRTVLQNRTISAPDIYAARESLADLLGVTLTPCCEDEPCGDCRAELKAEAMDRAVDLYRDDAIAREK